MEAIFHHCKHLPDVHADLLGASLASLTHFVAILPHQAITKHVLKRAANAVLAALQALIELRPALPEGADYNQLSGNGRHGGYKGALEHALTFLGAALDKASESLF